VSKSPASFNIQPGAPQQTVILTWPSGSAGTATLSVQAAFAATGNLVCTNAAGSAVSANCNVAVSNVACIPPPHHYQIQGPATGTTCGNNAFTIKAWADAAETVAYTAGLTAGTLTQSGNLASLPNLGAFSIPAGSSTASITPITFLSAGTTIFNTTATPPLAGATTCLFGSSTSCALVANSAACVADFNCTETTANASVAADANAGTGRLYTKVAGTAFSIDVMARSASGTVLTTYAADANKTVTVELVDSTTPAACASYPLLNPAVASNALSFTQASQPTEQGRKTTSFTVPNAFRNVSCRVTDNNGVKRCSTDSFAIRPPSGTLVTSPAMEVPPSATTASPVKAGAAFTLRINTAAGTNYSPSLTQDTSKLSAQLTSNTTTVQAGGTVGALLPTNVTSNASAVSASYSEAGYLYLAAGAFYDAAATAFTAVDSAGGDCVAGSFSDTPVSGKVGCNIGSATASLGRFIPDHFDTAILAGTGPTTPMGCPGGMTCPVNVTPGLSGFVYANQPFTVQVSAKNASGGTTSNYKDNFAKATTLSAWSAKGGAAANPGAGAMAGTAVVSTAFINGAAQISTASYGTTLPTLLGATDVYFRASEVALGDGVTSLQAVPASSVEAGLKVASGRIRISNAYGSDRLALPLPVTVQLYNGTNWLTSTSDSATTFNSALSPTGNLTATLVAGAANCISVNSPSSGAVSAGVRAISLQANAACSYTMSLTGMPSYLPITPSGGALVTFGVFKSPLIYRRENY
jgi:MSHA biogenesis protein MshQ